MTKVFLSPSDQDNNPVAGGGTEQDYAVTRCLAAAQVLTGAGVQVRVSQAGTGDDSAGFLASIAEGNAWSPDLYVADHTNATGVPGAVRSGIQIFAYLPDPASVALAHAVGKRLQPFIPGTPYRVMDGGHLGEVSSTNAPAILIEAGYHDNPSDAEIIRTRTVEMGRAIGAGILDYLGINHNIQEDDMQLTDIITRPDGHKGTVGDVLAYLDMRMERLEAAILGRGLPVFAPDGTDTGDKTDIATEAAWNRVNASRGLSEADQAKISEAIASSIVKVDVQVQGGGER